MTRFTREDGFTLTELLLVIAILGMVAAAIVGVYQISLQTYTRATSLEDAQLGARAGLDRMATELRLIGAYWTGAPGVGNAITAATTTSVSFMADVNGDTVNNGAETTVNTNPNSTTVGVSGTATQAANAFNVYSTSALNDYLYVANGATREVKQIAGLSGTTITLSTALTNSYAAGSVVRSVEIVTYTFNAATSGLTRSVGGSGADTIVDNVTGLTLTYFDGSNPPVQTSTLSQIREIQISLTTRGSDGSLRTMASRVRPRNLSLQ